MSRPPFYYWHVKAADGATNESRWAGTGSFYVGFVWALSRQISYYILIGLGALLLGVLGFWLGRRRTY